MNNINSYNNIKRINKNKRTQIDNIKLNNISAKRYSINMDITNLGNNLTLNNNQEKNKTMMETKKEKKKANLISFIPKFKKLFKRSNVVNDMSTLKNNKNLKEERELEILKEKEKSKKNNWLADKMQFLEFQNYFNDGEKKLNKKNILDTNDFNFTEEDMYKDDNFYKENLKNKYNRIKNLQKKRLFKEENTFINIKEMDNFEKLKVSKRNIFIHFLIYITSLIRLICRNIINFPAYDHISTIVIILNSIFLTFDIPGDNTETISDKTQDFFLYFYTTDMLIKIIANGLIIGKKSYLRSAWNILDAFIVVGSFLVRYLLSNIGINISAFRTLRVLRPLKTINNIKKLKTLISTIISALPNLFEIIIILIFVFLIFAIAGLQLLYGQLNRQCLNVTTGSFNNYFCKSDLDCAQFIVDANVVFRCAKSPFTPQYGVYNFDSLDQSFLMVFLITTQEGWSDIMTFVRRTYSDYMIIYFILIIFIGSFFLLNLVWAVIIVRFNDTQKHENDEQIIEPGGIVLKHYKKCGCNQGLNYQKSKLFEYFTDLSNNISKQVYLEKKEDKILNVFMNTMNKLKVQNPYTFKIDKIYNERFIQKEIKNEINFKYKDKKKVNVEENKLIEDQLSFDSGTNSKNSSKNLINENVKDVKEKENQLNKYKDDILNLNKIEEENNINDEDTEVKKKKKSKIDLKKLIKKQNFNLKSENKLFEIMRKSQIQNFNISDDEDNIDANNELFKKFNNINNNVFKNDPDFQIQVKNEEIYKLSNNDVNNILIDENNEKEEKYKNKFTVNVRKSAKDNTLSSLYNSNARNNSTYKIKNRGKKKIKDKHNEDLTDLEKWINKVNKLSNKKGKYLKLEVTFCKQYNPHPLFDSRKDIMPSLKLDQKKKNQEEKISIINNTKLNMIYDIKQIKEKYKIENLKEKNKFKDNIKDDQDSIDEINSFNDEPSDLETSFSTSGSKIFKNIFYANLNKVDYKNNYYPISNSLRGKESLKQLYKNQLNLLKNVSNKKIDKKIQNKQIILNNIYPETIEGMKNLFENKDNKNKIKKIRKKKFIKINKLHELILDKDLNNLEIKKYNYSGNDIMGLNTYNYDRTSRLLKSLNNPRPDIWVKKFYGKIIIFRRICREFIDSKFVEHSLTIFVLLNTLTLSLDGLNIPEDINNIIMVLNIFFTSVFAFEMLIKIIGYGIRGYSRDFFNIFDGLVVILSLVELTINQISGNTNGNALSAFKAVKIFRTFRVLRVTRILRSLRFMKVIIEVITRSLEQFVYIALLLFLFIFIFSLIGMQIFGNNFNFSSIPEENPRFNFDNFFNSFLTTFQLLTLENWNDVLISVLRSSVNNFLGIFILIVWIFVGNFIFLNLFLAILLDGFTSSSTTNSNWEFDLENEELDYMINLEKKNIKSKEKKKIEKNIKKKEIENLEYLEEIKVLKKSELKSSTKLNKTLLSKSKNSLSNIKIPKNKKIIQNNHNFNNLPDSSDEEHLDLLLKHKKFEETKNLFENVQCKKSVFIFDINSKFRIFCAKICSHDKFETVILFIIVLSSLKLILETYIYDQYKQFFDISDYVINGLFIIEASLKIIKYGFYICPGSYLSDNWSVLDFIIVFFSLLDMGLTSRNLGFIKILRTLRTLRPLRFISHNNNMKIMVNALLESIGAIANVAIVIFMIWIMFSILGMNILSGKLKYCKFKNPDKSYYGINQANCVINNGVWQSHNENFDNIFNSMTTLFILSSQESWPNIMGYAMDADDNQPMYNGSLYNSFFFIGFILVGALFLMNLFIGVIFFQFTKEQNRENKKSFAISQFLTDDQLKWILMQKLIEDAKPKCEYLEPPKNKIKLFFFKVSTSFIFETIIMVCIVLNIFVMGMIYDGMTDLYMNVLEYINYFFTAIFIFEFLFKIIGWGAKLYFMNDWNKFDFAIVLTSIVDLIFDLFFKNFSTLLRVGPQIIRVLKLFRITRLFKLIRNKSLQGINKILKTLIFSFPALLNVLLLLLLVYFIFSILGVFIFKNNSYTDNNPYNNDYWNFNNFGNALLILFRCSTGEGWNDIMFSYSLDPQGQNTNDLVSRIFFMIFIFLSSFIMINMFVLIIIDQFEKYYFNPDNPLNSFEEITEQFSLVWNYFTHKEHGQRIKEIDLVEFFSYLREPMGYRIVESIDEEGELHFDFDKEIKTRIPQNIISREIFKMNLKVDSEGYISFGQILHSALKNAYGRYSENTEKHIYKLLVKEENKSLAKIIKQNKELKKKFENEIVEKNINNYKIEVNPFMNLVLFQLTFHSWVRFTKKEKGLLDDEDNSLNSSNSNSNEKFDESYIRKLIEENRNDKIEESSINEDN